MHAVHAVYPLVEQRPRLVTVATHPGVTVQDISLLAKDLLSPQFTSGTHTVPDTVVRVSLTGFRRVYGQRMSPTTYGQVALQIAFPGEPALVRLKGGRTVRVLAGARTNDLLRRTTHWVEVHEQVTRHTTKLRLGPTERRMPWVVEHAGAATPIEIRRVHVVRATQRDRRIPRHSLARVRLHVKKGVLKRQISRSQVRQRRTVFGHGTSDHQGVAFHVKVGVTVLIKGRVAFHSGNITVHGHGNFSKRKLTFGRFSRVIRRVSNARRVSFSATLQYVARAMAWNNCM